MKSLSVALLGNPNTGKSSLFNALVGMHQRTGNFPGVTVEKKTGSFRWEGQEVAVTDLPGTYSLAPNAPDEQMTFSAVVSESDSEQYADVIVCVLDANNLARNMYLVSQALELDRPVVIALNMMDLARKAGLDIKVDQFSEKLGVPVVEIQATRRLGIEELKKQIVSCKSAPAPQTVFPRIVHEELARLLENSSIPAELRTGFWLRRLLLDTTNRMAPVLPIAMSAEAVEAIGASREKILAAEKLHGLEPVCRYRWIESLLDGVVEKPGDPHGKYVSTLDRILTHPVLGSVLFVIVMAGLFQAVFRWAMPVMDLVDGCFGWLGGWVEAAMQPGALRSLIVDGLIAGVGAVVIFLPQIVILFFFIAWLEGCGYMARAAWLMDRLMARVGLSGRSFVPLLSSFACAIPGIMATRTIRDRRDRLTTMLVAPLMSCSARLPVYVLLIAACVPNRFFAGGWIGLQGLVMFAMYMLGIIVAVLVAFVLKKTILKGPTPSFVMELPGFKWPSLRVVMQRMAAQGWGFIQGAGTLIMAVTVIVWAAGYFPRNPEIADQVRTSYQEQIATLQATEESSKALSQLEEIIAAEIQGAQLRQSILGKAGNVIEPLVRPLGWDWRIGVSVIASFPAREVVIGTMGVIYNLGEEADEESPTLRQKLQTASWDDDPKRRVFTLPVALSIMVFFALCAQCGATLVVLKKETQSWRWPVFTFCYMTSIAYLAAFLTYQVASLLV